MGGCGFGFCKGKENAAYGQISFMPGDYAAGPSSGWGPAAPGRPHRGSLS